MKSYILTEEGEDERARHRWGGNIWVRGRWRLVVEINNNEGRSGRGGSVEATRIILLDEPN
jgi:hypothetical protein